MAVTSLTAIFFRELLIKCLEASMENDITDLLKKKSILASDPFSAHCSLCFVFLAVWDGAIGSAYAVKCASRP